jgi:hypothetical protein
MDIKDDDHESLEFLAKVRTMITDWLAQGKVSDACSHSRANELTQTGPSSMAERSAA